MKASRFNILRETDSKKFIYNSFSKAVIETESDDTIMHLVHKRTDDAMSIWDKDVCATLQGLGMIVEDNSDELLKLEYVFNKRYFDETVLTLVLLPTLKCNFSCDYCFQKSDSSFIEASHYFDTLRKYLGRNLAKKRHLHISLFGGEPLIKKKELINFLNNTKSECEKLNVTFDTSIVTNGSLIDDDVIETLIACGCKYFQITIDGPRFQHDTIRKFGNGSGSYDLLIHNIIKVARRVKDIDPFKVCMRFNLNNNTVQEIASVLEEIPSDIRNKVHTLFRLVFNTKKYCGDNKNNYNELSDFLDLSKDMGFAILKNKRYYSSCEACGDLNTLHVMPDLSVRKCVNNLDSASAHLGTILPSGDIELDADKVLNWYKHSNGFHDEKCRQCSLLADCLGGCILNRERSVKDNCSDFHMVSLSNFY